MHCHCTLRRFYQLVPQFSVGSKIIAEEGVGALYRGLSAGLLRQATYTTARLGIYQYISDVLAKRHEGKVCAADGMVARQPPGALTTSFATAMTSSGWRCSDARATRCWLS